MTNVSDVLGAVQEHLDQAGIDSPAAEAAIIVAHVLQVSRGKLGVMQVLGEDLTEASVANIDQLVQARATRVPLQHLTGQTTFYGVDLHIEPGVFIPRVETEVLVETTLHHVRDAGWKAVNLLDLCTGSGAIAAALAAQLAHYDIDTRVWAVDLNSTAVGLARQNTDQYKVSVLCADATDTEAVLAADPELAAYLGTFDVVVSNPPYIPTLTPVTQAEAVQDPELALYGGSADGLAVPLDIADAAATWLAPGGFFMMEHDHTHAADLSAALRANSEWQDVRTVQDLTETDRFVSAVRA